MNDSFCARWFLKSMDSLLKKPYVHILFGARQTGKTSILKHLTSHCSLWYNLADPEERNRHILDPGVFARECKSLPFNGKPLLVVVDEAQTVPSIFDAIQALYDTDKTRWRFVLCGSSARKLRSTGSNLLPGRSVKHHLYPLVLCERPAINNPTHSYIVPFQWHKEPHEPLFPATDIEERLAFGDLPGVICLPHEDRTAILRSYASIYLEEEIRREATIRDWNAFINFLRLAASYSGEIINYSAMSRETGISITTIKSHYQLLEDIFVGFSIPGYTGSTRKALLSTPKFFFVDLGLRHAAAGLIPGDNLVAANPGPVFEHWVGLELWKRLQYLQEGKLYYLRAKSGMEIDYIIALNDQTIPVEVKWTKSPSVSDARHLNSFIKDTPNASRGYVVCRCQRPQALSETVTAIPWWMI
ncbi:ATP-binding protein [Chitinispirillales bacterium ANBcel5]|uniref:ATP-binding protein n=1 Tax=Cellulosispirillum alkaliphilum TaxID=3039283 RepID=UPI002A58F0D0|nr:ATP-binding protein [Chitinispirillales bacterium ANBcel5]